MDSRRLAACTIRHKLTPYEGERLRGRVKRTYVRGQLAFDEGKFAGGPRGTIAASRMTLPPVTDRELNGGCMTIAERG